MENLGINVQTKQTLVINYTIGLSVNNTCRDTIFLVRMLRPKSW